MVELHQNDFFFLSETVLSFTFPNISPPFGKDFQTLYIRTFM